MPLYGPEQNAVLIKGGIMVWDGITAPDTGDSGKQRWSAKIVVPPGNPDVPLLDNLAQACLVASKWKGVLPAGGRMPVGTATPHEFNGMFPGWSVINCTTYQMPRVYEEGTGRQLTPMEYGALFFTGQRVDVVVTCWDYDNVGKGIGSALEGISAVVSEGAQPISIGGSGLDASSAFGGQATAPAAAPTPAPAPAPAPAAAPAQPAQAHDFLTGTTAPAPAPAPAPPPAPAPAPRMYTYNGVNYTREQLQGAGWSDAQIDALP